jgi:hypothetical protein
MIAPVRRLSDAGLDRYRAWLDAGAPGAVPRHLLDDPQTSEPLPVSRPRPERAFTRRYALGVALVELLEPLDAARVRYDVGLWDWLSLHLFDQLCPLHASGRRKLSKRWHYALEVDGFRHRPRHLVRSAWNLVYLHGPHARFLLWAPPHTHGELTEQLASTQELIASTSFIEACAIPYWDEERQDRRRGFGGKGPGSARRIPFVRRQFRLTYDIDHMPAEAILALLPREFDRFRPDTARTRRPSPPSPSPPGRAQGLLARLWRAGPGAA